MFTRVLATPQSRSTTQRMKISISSFFSKCDQIRRKLRSGHISEETFNRKLHFLCKKRFLFDNHLKQSMLENSKEKIAIPSCIAFLSSKQLLVRSQQ